MGGFTVKSTGPSLGVFYFFFFLALSVLRLGVLPPLLARRSVQGRGQKWARRDRAQGCDSRGGRGGRRAPGTAARGAGGGADRGRSLRPGATPPLLLAGLLLLLLLGLEGLAAHVVVLLPVLVLAEGAAVARGVTAATRLAGLAPTVTAALEGQWGERGRALVKTWLPAARMLPRRTPQSGESGLVLLPALLYVCANVVLYFGMFVCVDV